MILATLLGLSTAWALPNYKFELLARTNSSSTYNMPSQSYISNANPTINDRGDVAFKVVFSDQAGIWLKEAEQADGHMVYLGPIDKLLGDPEMTSQKKIIFSIFDDMKTDGIFSYDIDKNQADVIFSSSDFYSLGYPQDLGNGTYAFRSTDYDNVRTFFEYSRQILLPVVKEEQEYSYLFGPVVNQASQWVFKAQLSDKNQILTLEPQFNMLGEKKYSLKVVAQDQNADILSPYKYFDNMTSLSDNGYLIFTATLQNKKRCIVAVKNGVHFQVAVEGENDIESIELFSAKINNNGLVVFRAIDQNGLRGIYLAKAFSLNKDIKKLIGEGDPIHADMGMVSVLKRQNFPGFSGNVDINNRNEIVFSTILATPDHKWIYGTSIYKMHPL